MRSEIRFRQPVAKVAAAVFLLVVGCACLLLTLWVLLSLLAILDGPERLGYVLAFWSGCFAGPVVLILGAALLLRRPASMAGTRLTCLGCLALTGFAIYNSAAGMQRAPLQAPTPYGLFGLLLIVTLLADVAGYKLVKPMLSPRY